MHETSSHVAQSIAYSLLLIRFPCARFLVKRENVLFIKMACGAIVVNQNFKQIIGRQHQFRPLGAENHLSLHDSFVALTLAFAITLNYTLISGQSNRREIFLPIFVVLDIYIHSPYLFPD